MLLEGCHDDERFLYCIDALNGNQIGGNYMIVVL